MVLVEKRRKEILSACEKLYEIMSFKEITLKEIGEVTSFTRTSIYNYFQTKEEIFLALFEREYEYWTEDIKNIIDSNESLEKEEIAEKLAKTLEKRKLLLKILAGNIYDMEENSRMEELTEFKKAYGNSMKMVRKCIDKFFNTMSEDKKDEFIFLFFPFMYGIYPYAEVTEKQKQAMSDADVPFKYLTIYEITYKGILQFLK